MAGPIRDPQVTQQQKDDGIDLIDVADFLFGVRSIERIAKGKGSWGDLLNVGVSAATFFIAPAKLAALSTKALSKVVVNTGKVIDNPITSEAAKRAARTTADQAQVLLRQRTTPFEAQDVEDLTKVIGSRAGSEDVLAAGGGLMQESAYVAKTLRQFSPGDFAGSEWDEIFKGVVASKDVKMSQEVVDTMVAYKGFINSGNPVPKWLKQDMKRAGFQIRGEKIAAQVEKEMPAKLPKENLIREEVDEETGKVIRTIDEATDYSKDPLPENPTEGMVTREVPLVDRVAFLRNEIDKLKNYNIKNYEKTLPRAKSGKKADDVYERIEKNKKLIDKYQKEYNQKASKLSVEERKLADKKASELKAEDLGTKNKLGKTKPDLGTKRRTEETSKRLNQQLEDLREQWRNTTNVAERNKLKQQAKVIADRLKKMEGK